MFESMIFLGPVIRTESPFPVSAGYPGMKLFQAIRLYRKPPFSQVGADRGHRMLGMDGMTVGGLPSLKLTFRT